jgi:thiol-disulfide isomerase/thioredoxin
VSRYHALIVLAAAWGAAGCAGAELREQAATITHLQARVAEFQGAAERAQDLRSRLEEMRSAHDTLSARLDLAEQRLGVAPFRSNKVHVLPAPLHLDLPNASRLEHPEAPARRTNLRQHLATQRGTIIAFWATWCVPCTSDEELAHLQVLQQELRQHDADLLSMAIDELDKVRADPRASRWIRPLWHLIDGHLELPPREFIQRVGINLPLFLVVDSEGRVHAYVNRKLDDETVEDLITAVMRLR